jgi:hypothetical protein
MPDGIDLPRYRCHKAVREDKIIASGTMHWSLACGGSVILSMELRGRVPEHVDPVGGYYVLYDDGFESWSPAKAFEDGYTKL